MLPIHTILVPFDFSNHSAQAFAVACSLARAAGAKVVLLHVAPGPMIGYGGMIPPALPADYRRRLVDDLEKVVPTVAGVPVQRRVEEGDAVGHILRDAESLPAELIVMGTHGRTGLARLLLGSTAEAVLRKASCPVLLVKAPAANEPAATIAPAAAGASH
jgi:nucleotide-binding universal stress UspA family protein